MKKLHIALLLLAALFFVSAGVQAQSQFTAASNVKLGPRQIQGERMPRLTTELRDSIPKTPFLQGVIIFNKDTKRQEYWDGKKWVSFGSNPWYDVNTNTSAGAAADSIYHLGPVTIGSMELSLPGAILQMKNKDGVNDDAFNSTKGMALPRVVLSKKKELFPMFLRKPTDSASDPNDPVANPPIQEYINNKATWDKSHTGLIVYNLTENDEEELCLGLNQWDGEQWNCFETKMGNAIAHIENCDEFKIFGQYKSANTPSTTLPDNFPLDASNFITIKLDVEKPGAYTLNIVPSYAADINETNGYFFTASGVFMEKGMYTVTIPGMGTPFWYTPDTHPSGDVLNITMNNKPLVLEDGSSCVKNIKVQDYSKKPNFEIDCGRTTVHGVYTMNKELDPVTNYLSVWIKIDPSDPFVEGATVFLETNEVEGIRFVSTPSIVTAADRAAGEKQIILTGSGKPTTFETKRMTISSNSVTSVATCYANVLVAYTKKKTYGWGWYDNVAGYIMNIYNDVKQGTTKIVDADVNFGTDETSTVKVVKQASNKLFDHKIISGADAYDADKVKAMFDEKPEIVLSGFDLDVVNKNAVAGHIIDYLNKGGVLIFVCEKQLLTEALFEKLYPGLDVNTTWISTIRLPFGFFNDEILNGPFGDIRGKFYGNDTEGAISVRGLPEEDILVYARGSNGEPTMFQHKFYNLIFIGEGGIFANYDGKTGSDGGTASDIYYPVAIDDEYRPITCTDWRNGPVENARLFANVMAWAIKTAQFKGINAPK